MAWNFWSKRSGSAQKAVGDDTEVKGLPDAVGLRECVQPADSLQAVDIVFVHGLRGGRESTWTHRPTKSFWPENLLPSDVPDARIFTYGYDADVAHFFSSASLSRIGDHARTLLSELSRTRERSETNERPLFFIAHSLGGLIVEDMLLSSKNSAEAHHRQILESTEGLVFMGTPHCGSKLADWAKIGTSMLKVAKRSNESIVSVLQPDSEVLARIQQDFHTMIRARSDAGKHSIRIVCFHEALPYPGIGMIVQEGSAILNGYTSISIQGDHTGMTKFRDRKDPGYQAVEGELGVWIRDLKKRREQTHTQRDSDPVPFSSAQPVPSHPDSDSDGSTRHYYMGSMNNVGQVFQGAKISTFNVGDRRAAE